MLCLHDSNHSGSALEFQSKNLRDRLKEKHDIELVFVDSPFVCGNHESIVSINRRDSGGFKVDSNLLSSTTSCSTIIPCSIQNNPPKSDCSSTEDIQQLPLQEPNVSDVVLSVSATSSLTHQNDHTYGYNRCWFENIPSEIYTKNQDIFTNGNSSSSSINEDDVEQRPINVEYVGLDASLFHLGQLWNQNLLSKPYQGILAFGQGAALAGIIQLIQKRQREALKKNEKKTEHYYMPGLQFMVLVSGYPLNPPPHKSKCRGVPSTWHVLQNGIIDSCSIDTLHMIGMRNAVVTPTQSMCLAKRFTFPRICQYDCGDHHPYPVLRTAAYYNVIGRFLVRQKKKNPSLKCPDILLLQRQLHNTEERATQLLINTLASNPPRALMAIISPNTVGGWLGTKEPSSEDGGGAPCPLESISKRTSKRIDRHA